MQFFIGLSELVDSYRAYLSHHQFLHPRQCAATRFDERLRTGAEAAAAEAVAFEFLRARNLEPTILEDASTGGCDFECRYRGQAFAVEVTALTNDTMTKRSGIDENFQAGYIDMPSILGVLRSRLSNKSTASQARKYAGPKVLFIATQHISTNILFMGGLEEFLTGSSKIVVPIAPSGKAAAEPYMATELSNAAHLTKDNAGQVTTFRPAYALVLIAGIAPDKAQIMGLIHPEPEYELSYHIFPEVPFVRVKWPVSDKLVEVEWVIAQPRPCDDYYFPIELTEAELRKGVQ